MLGQNKDHQLNTLAPLLMKLEKIVIEVEGSASTPPCSVRNGYAQADDSSLNSWHNILRRHADELASHLQVGIQSDTQVTYPNVLLKNHPPLLVTQVYASAVPVAYGMASCESWEPLARIVLCGVYEATFLAAIRQALRLKMMNQDPDDHQIMSQRVFLTLVGGGVFGNEISWIYDAIKSAWRSISSSNYHANLILDVSIVHFFRIPAHADDFIREMVAMSQ